MPTNPFTVTIYSKALAFQQRLGFAVSYSFTPRWGLGTGEVVTRADDPANVLLRQDGARLVVEYRGEVLMSGPLVEETGPAVEGGTCKWTLYDDAYPALAWVRAWVQPAGNLTPVSLIDPGQQVPPAAGHTSGRADGSGYYAWPTNPAVLPAETALKRVISDNLARFAPATLQGKIVVQPDQGRGGDARAAGMLPQLRFDALSEALTDLQEWANLGIRVWQDGSSMKLDCWQPVTWVQQIGARSGVVTDGTYQRNIPTTTRLVLGGPDNDAARFFTGSTDTALEARYGFAVETFTEATGTTLTWPDGLDDAAKVAAYYLQRTDVDAAAKATFQTYISQAIDTALATGGPTTGLDLTLSETDAFHYGGPDGYHVGDQISAVTAPGVTVTERVTECTLTYSTQGFSVVPKVGAIQQDPTAQLAEAVAALAAVIGRIQSRT